MSENRKVEFIVFVSVDENDVVTGTQPALCRFLGRPVRELQQWIEGMTGAYQKDGPDVPTG